MAVEIDASSENMTPLLRPTLIWDDNIKTNLKDVRVWTGFI
jgi:hypothetical protein